MLKPFPRWTIFALPALVKGQSPGREPLRKRHLDLSGLPDCCEITPQFAVVRFSSHTYAGFCCCLRRCAHGVGKYVDAVPRMILGAVFAICISRHVTTPQIGGAPRKWEDGEWRVR